MRYDYVEVLATQVLRHFYYYFFLNSLFSACLLKIFFLPFHSKILLFLCAVVGDDTHALLLETTLMRCCWRRHACASFIFSIAMLNGTCLFHSMIINEKLSTVGAVNLLISVKKPFYYSPKKNMLNKE